MKFTKLNVLGTLSSLCLACAYIMHWEGCSLIFFGEYPFPEE